MTEQVAVQNQGNYAVPGFLGGAALGAVGGHYLDKTGYDGFTKAKYNSFDDILKESKDNFTPSTNATDETEAALENIKNKRAEFVTDMKNLASKRAWDPKVAVEGAAVDTAKNNYKDAYKKLLDKAKAGTLVSGTAGITDEKEAMKAVNAYIKENIGKADGEITAELKTLKEAKQAIKTARENLVAKANAENVKAHKVVDGLVDAIADKKKTFFDSIKDDVAKVKTSNKVMNAVVGACVLALAGLGIGAMIKDNEA